MYRETVNLGEKVLSMADIAEAKTDAWLLLEMVCKSDRSFYYLHMEEEMPEEQMSEYQIALRKRAEHVPLQYIVGETEFMGLKFKFQCPHPKTGYRDSGGRGAEGRAPRNACARSVYRVRMRDCQYSAQCIGCGGVCG